MTILGLQAATELSWLLAIAFLGAGIFNGLGSASVKDGFIRWGYPDWWNVVTAALEIMAAVLIAVPATRLLGLVLGVAICVAAVATVLRHREYAHLPPGGALILLLTADIALLSI